MTLLKLELNLLGFDPLVTTMNWSPIMMLMRNNGFWRLALSIYSIHFPGAWPFLFCFISFNLFCVAFIFHKTVWYINVFFNRWLISWKEQKSHNRAGIRGSTVFKIVWKIDPPFWMCVFIVLWVPSARDFMNFLCGFNLITCLFFSGSVPFNM